MRLLSFRLLAALVGVGILLPAEGSLMNLDRKFNTGGRRSYSSSRTGSSRKSAPKPAPKPTRAEPAPAPEPQETPAPQPQVLQQLSEEQSAYVGEAEFFFRCWSRGDIGAAADMLAERLGPVCDGRGGREESMTREACLSALEQGPKDVSPAYRAESVYSYQSGDEVAVLSDIVSENRHHAFLLVFRRSDKKCTSVVLAQDVPATELLSEVTQDVFLLEGVTYTADQPYTLPTVTISRRVEGLMRAWQKGDKRAVEDCLGGSATVMVSWDNKPDDRPQARESAAALLLRAPDRLRARPCVVSAMAHMKVENKDYLMADLAMGTSEVRGSLVLGFDEAMRVTFCVMGETAEPGPVGEMLLALRSCYGADASTEGWEGRKLRAE